MKQRMFARAPRPYEKPILAMCALLTAHMAVFALLERLPRQVHRIECSLDALLPFVPQMILPYLGWFLWVPAGLVYLMRRDTGRFWRCFVVLAGGILITLALYAVWPTGLDLRGTVHGSDLCSRLVRLLYAIDTPTNVCPSLHVFVSLVVLFGLWGAVGRFGRLANAAMTAAVCASTVLLDQHSLVDVAMALALAVALWLALPEQAAAPGAARKRLTET